MQQHLGLDLNVGMKLEQKLSPQMIQSLKLLQVTALQLETMVTQELEGNPLLEQEEEIQDNVEKVTTESGEEVAADKAVKEEEFKELEMEEPKKEEVDWEKFFEDGFDPGFRRSEDTSGQDQRLEHTPVAAKSMQDQLLFQLLHKRVLKRVKELVEYLINCLDDDGYLRHDSIQLENFPVNISEKDPEVLEIQDIINGKKLEQEASRNVREAFFTLRRLDPPGIGALNLQQCLLIQIERLGIVSPLAEKIVREEFDLLKKLKISVIAKNLDLLPETVQKAVKEIGRLDPRPGRLLGDNISSPITPDLIVDFIDGEIILLFNDRYLPSLKISRNYSKLLNKESNATSEEKKYIREKLNSATWLIKAIEQRKTTMMRVMHAIIENQPEFFSKGPTYLKPLILQNIADKIGMHISTVSRVINGKYVQTPHGIYELKYFFTSGVSQEDGEEISSIQVKDRIKALIRAEDPKKPLSDQKIAGSLKSEGMDVARRTVAKYRDQLQILPARLRKQF